MIYYYYFLLFILARPLSQPYLSHPFRTLLLLFSAIYLGPSPFARPIHPLHLFSFFPIPVAHLALFLLERETLQGEQRANAVEVRMKVDTEASWHGRRGRTRGCGGKT